MQGQVQANVQSQQQTTDTPSPFARPGSWAGTRTMPASEAGVQPAPSNLFTWPNSHALIIIVTYERPSVSGGRKYVC